MKIVVLKFGGTSVGSIEKIKNVSNIIKNYNCICFHTAPLPYGRGGSPIQNLIKRNYKKTPICALKMSNKIDAGPIFLKKNIFKVS